MVAPFIKQTWTVSGVLLNMVAQGMVLGYPSSIVPALLAPDSSIKTDLDTTSWIASSVGAAGVPGFLISSYLMAKIGRKIAHGLIIIPGAVGWIMIFFANNVALLLIGRILCGMTAGGTVGLGAVVIGEFTHPKHRGMFLNLKTAAVYLGGMVVHIFGYYYHWRTIALIAVLPHIVAIGIICTWPESPAWLASQKQFEKSKKAFIWLRGRSENAVEELEELIRAQKSQPLEPTKEMSIIRQIKEFLKKFTRKDFLKPLFIMVISEFLLETSGRHLFPAYAIQIISEVTGNKSQSFYYTLAIDIIITASAIFSSVLVKMMKRRTLLFSTGFGSVGIIFTVCLYIYLVEKYVISPNHVWIPISLFIVYFILANLGCTPIPMALLGEIFPLAHRSAGSCISGIIMSLALNFSLQLAPYMLIGMGVHGTFAVLGVISTLFLIILYFVLPETKDRTLQEIDDYFNFGKFKDDEKDIEREEGVKMKMIG